MFINIRLSKLFKIFFIIVAIIMFIIFIISLCRIFTRIKNISKQNNLNEIIEITTNNYTNVLKAVHDDIDSYVGKSIKFSGYVYRVYDLTDTQFVLARNMIISSDNRAVVVGFLCNYKNASNFQNDSWVEITGTITKGSYHGEMPIIEIITINKVNCPTDEFVYPPNDSFVPTSSII